MLILSWLYLINSILFHIFEEIFLSFISIIMLALQQLIKLYIYLNSFDFILWNYLSKINLLYFYFFFFIYSPWSNTIITVILVIICFDEFKFCGWDTQFNIFGVLKILFLFFLIKLFGNASLYCHSEFYFSKTKVFLYLVFFL